MSLRRGRAVLSWTLRLLVSVGFIGYLIYRVGPQQIVAVFHAAAPLYFLSAVLVAVLDRAFMAAKWYPLLRAQLPGARFGPALKAYWASSLASVILPASVGGDAIRAFAVGRSSGNVVEVGASIVTERLLGVFASGVLSLVAIAIALQTSLRLQVLVPWALLSAALALGVLVLSLTHFGRQPGREADPLPKSRWRRVMRRFATAQAVYRDHPRLLVLLAALTILEQTFPIWVLLLIGRAIGSDVTLRMLVVAVPLTMFVARFPIAIWGLGVLEASLIYLLGMFGIPPAEALALSLAGRAAEVIAVLPGAFLLYDLTHAGGPARSPTPEPGAPAGEVR